MSNDIKAGDLVMVVRPQSCGCIRELYKQFKVDSIDYLTGRFYECSTCGKDIVDSAYASDGNGYGYEIKTLKKIPPLSDLEDVTTHRQDLIPNEQEA